MVRTKKGSKKKRCARGGKPAAGLDTRQVRSCTRWGFVFDGKGGSQKNRFKVLGPGGSLKTGGGGVGARGRGKERKKVRGEGNFHITEMAEVSPREAGSFQRGGSFTI